VKNGLKNIDLGKQKDQTLVFKPITKSDDVVLVEGTQKRKLKFRPYGYVETVPGQVTFLTRSGFDNMLIAESTMDKTVATSRGIKNAPESLQDSKLVVLSYRLCIVPK